MEKQMITIVNDIGEKKQVELISILPSKRDEKVYLIYTEDDSELGDEVDLCFAIIKDEGENFTIEAIDSDEEFKYVQELMEAEVQ